MIVWPDTDSAVQTMPAIAITKNMPAWPLTPNRSSTTDEMITVSIVMPETGLRAVVAMALAATDVKKNENTQRRAPARCAIGGERRRAACRRTTATARAPSDHADQLREDRDVAVGALAA